MAAVEVMVMVVRPIVLGVDVSVVAVVAMPRLCRCRRGAARVADVKMSCPHPFGQGRGGGGGILASEELRRCF